jgi:phosphoribosylaminoimidazole-succinocarboxamide synthase
MAIEELVKLILANIDRCITDLDIPGLPAPVYGKVRNGYPLPGGLRLLIARDNLTAFDQQLAHVPYKGQVLTQLAAWWFDAVEDIVQHHMVDVLDPNVTLVEDVEPLPIEAVVRGHIAGVTSTSLWTMYAAGQRTMYGQHFPDGLRKNQKLAQPVFTPTSKAPKGKHDAPLTIEKIIADGIMSKELLDAVIEISMELFRRGQDAAALRGKILVDTKYEFGLRRNGDTGKENLVVLIDEIHTPDSSRFFDADEYDEFAANGYPEEDEPEHWDKEFVRRWYASHGYTGKGVAPKLPIDMIVETSLRYISIFEALTGQEFVPAEYPALPRITNNLQKAGLLTA